MTTTGDIRDAFIPGVEPLLTPTLITPMSEECIGNDWHPYDTGWASVAYTQNLTTYVPLMLAEPRTVKKMFWVNGSTVDTAGHTDVGIYDFAGTTLIGHTGATLNSGASVRQVVDVTDFLLPAEQRLWMAITSDSATHTYIRANPVIQIMDIWGCKQHASDYSSGLPSTATFNDPTVGIIPLFGFTSVDV